MQYSYWEQNEYFKHIDYAIIGGGIVGMSTALELKEKYPKAKIVIYERCGTPQGASTKNAGFACFGSASEVLEDIDIMGMDAVATLVENRVRGLEILRSRLGDNAIDLKKHGGYELFRYKDAEVAARCEDNLDVVNMMTRDILGKKVYRIGKNPFGFENILPTVIINGEEAQVDTGKMMTALARLVVSQGIQIIHGVQIDSIIDEGDVVCMKHHEGDVCVQKVVVTNNGFASKLLDLDVDPARAQIVVTSPIAGLPHQGTFHIDRGYNYFRNIHGRILLGGGRNLDYDAERTVDMGTTEKIQTHLEELLRTVILPGYSYTIDQRWSGIMGMSSHRSPIVSKISENVYCAVRLSGMGIALSSRIAKQCAEIVE